MSRKIFQRIKSPNLKWQRVCPEDSFQRIKPPNLKWQGVCPEDSFQRIKSPNLKSQGLSFPENHLPKSQIASLRFFVRESSPQISNRKGCRPKIFSDNQVPKSQIATGVPVRFFPENQVPKSQIARAVLSRESSPQISNRKPKIFCERIKSPNLKSQGVPP